MALTWQGIVVISFTALSLLIMGFDLVGPDIVFTVLLAFFCAFDGKIIPVATAGQQYGNTGLLTVIFLYWVAEGVSQTGGLEAIMTFVLGRSRSPFWALVRMMIPTMLLSAFLNNTPVVALMIPILLAWSKRCGIPSKKLLIPLSFASVFGGTCTLIGTSTNLVVQSLATQAYIKGPKKDEAVFKIFDIAPVGIPYAIWGFLFVILSQRWLLPGNSSRYAKDLLVAMRVVPGSPVRRKTLIESGLRGVPSVSLVGVYHKNAFYSTPAADYLLEEGDIIYFAGELDNIEFVGEEYGLGFVTSETEEGGDVVPELAEQTFEANRAGPYGKLVQVTVAPESPLLGLTIHDSDFTGRFNAAVIAIKRGRNRPDGRIREAVLTVGDILVLDTLPGFDSTDPDLQASFTKIVYVKDSTAKEFVVGLRVKRGAIDEAASTALRKDVNLGGGIIGKTVTAAGLRGIPGLYVLAIDRADGTHIENISFTDIIQPDDTIWFAADLASIGFLSRFPGLELVQQQQVEKSGVNILNRTLIQAAVALKGPLVGKTVRDVRFRSKYNAAVVAVHRNGVRMPLRVQDIVLQDGDVLLLSASGSWVSNNRHDRAFVMLSEVPNSSPPKKSKMVIAVLLAVGMITTQIVGGIQSREYIHLWPCAVLTAGLMLATGCMSADNARKAILWDVYLTIAAAFGVSASMERTGVAREFANIFVDLSRKLGGGNAALLCIYIATALLSEILTNNAAGAIMYPIARILGDELNTGVRAMSYAVMLGASAGFTNPFSYQCNLMVYSAGNYRTVEFVRIGVPLQIFMTIAAGFILAYRNSWHELWIISFCVAGVVIGVPALYSYVPDKYTIPIDMWAERKLDAVGRALAPLAFWRKIKLPKLKRGGGSFWSSKSTNGNYLTGSSPAPPLVVPVKAADGTGASTPVAAKDETSSNSSRD